MGAGRRSQGGYSAYGFEVSILPQGEGFDCVTNKTSGDGEWSNVAKQHRWILNQLPVALGGRKGANESRCLDVLPPNMYHTFAKYVPYFCQICTILLVQIYVSFCAENGVKRNTARFAKLS